MTDFTPQQAHQHSSAHRSQIEASAKCGCFYCLNVFAPSQIEEWVDDDDTALCPRCGIDSVIGDASGVPVTNANFMQSMQNLWFQR
ncbi:hypothetical protein D3C86_2089260 [compost metagenome]